VKKPPQGEYVADAAFPYAPDLTADLKLHPKSQRGIALFTKG